MTSQHKLILSYVLRVAKKEEERNGIEKLRKFKR